MAKSVKDLLCCTRRSPTQNFTLDPSDFTWEEHYLLDDGIEADTCDSRFTWDGDDSVEAGLHSKSSSEDNRNSPDSFLNMCHLQDESGSFTTSSTGSLGLGDSDKENVDIRGVVQDILFSAAQLEGTVHIDSCHAFSKSLKEGYIAAIPQDLGAAFSGESFQYQIRRWKGGTLAYWNTRPDGPVMEGSEETKRGTDCSDKHPAFQDHMAKQAPTGYVPLLQISEVVYATNLQGGHGAIVKHMQEGEMCELILLFPDRICAVKWVYTMCDFLTMLRRHDDTE